MTSPVEMTAAMTPQAEQHDPGGGAAAPGAAALAESASEAVVSVSRDAGKQAAGRRELSQNAVIALFGGLVTTLLGALIGLMMWQFNALGDRIDGLDARNDSLGAELRAEMSALEAGLRADMAKLESELRAEMRAGFAEINTVLLDHTDRLARLEAAAGLPRAGG